MPVLPCTTAKVVQHLLSDLTDKLCSEKKLTLNSVKTIVTGSNKYLKSYHDQINSKLLRKTTKNSNSFVINNKHLLLLNQL